MSGIHRHSSQTNGFLGRRAGAAVTGRRRGIERLIHDLADGAGAAAALGAAAEAAIDLPGRARPRLRRDGGTDIVVGQNVAGANDHKWVPSGIIDTSGPDGGQKKSTVFIGCLKSETRLTTSVPASNSRWQRHSGWTAKPWL